MSNNYQSPAAKNSFQKILHNTVREAGNPADEQLRVSYGTISEVNQETSQVKVRRYKDDGSLGEEIAKGFFPIMNPLSEIHMNYGLLREGLVVRIWWRGKLQPQNALIEVIGDEDLAFLQKKPEQNEIEIGPFKIFS